MVKIGIIGGSGLDNPTILENGKDIEVNTPYGQPSSLLKVGTIKGIDVVLLARHGRDHSIIPSNVNNQANIWALKEVGCTHILASTACGSLKENIKPGDFVFLDQFIDRTTKRKQTFYEQGQVCHIPMANPFCAQLRQQFTAAAQRLGFSFHPQGTIITIEGPRFSSRAESKLFRSWNADVINMSTVPEVVLAREAGICYAAVAMSTDYDCWHTSEEAVTWEAILKVFSKNVVNVISLFLEIIPLIQEGECQCQKDIKTSIVGGHTEKKSSINNFDLKNSIRTIPNWPKLGVMFRDITTLLQDPNAFKQCIEKFKEHYQNKGITKIVGIESRGFIFGAALARELHLPFVLIRKPGKLPAATVSQEYELEYGKDKIEIHQDAISVGDKVLITDDLIATGGTIVAATQLVEKLGGEVTGIAVVINLPELKGAERVNKYNPFWLVEFEGE